MKHPSIYIASSWKNPIQPEVVKTLRDEGFHVYDFRNPFYPLYPNDHNKGFSWTDIDPMWKAWSFNGYMQGLKHISSIAGYNADLTGMKRADVCVLVLPSGRSAHIEAGWFKGAGKKLIIFQSTMVKFEAETGAELMYLMADLITSNINEVIRSIKEMRQNEK